MATEFCQVGVRPRTALTPNWRRTKCTNCGIIYCGLSQVFCSEECQVSHDLQVIGSPVRRATAKSPGNFSRNSTREKQNRNGVDCQIQLESKTSSNSIEIPGKDARKRCQAPKNRHKADGFLATPAVHQNRYRKRKQQNRPVNRGHQKTALGITQPPFGLQKWKKRDNHQPIDVIEHVQQKQQDKSKVGIFA